MSARFGIRPLARRLAGEWLLVAACLIGVAFAAIAQGFRGDAWKFPTVVGVLTAALAAAELVKLLRADPEEGAAPADPALRRRGAILALWFAATLAGVYVAGLLVTVGVATALYMRAILGAAPLHAGAAGLAHALFFWAAFERLAGFRLWGGIL